jgi:hypothetical protein
MHTLLRGRFEYARITRMSFLICARYRNAFLIAHFFIARALIAHIQPLCCIVLLRTALIIANSENAVFSDPHISRNRVLIARS